MTWHEEHPGGIIACDAPGCTRTRRNYCSPSERELWVAYQRGNVILDLCPAHRRRSLIQSGMAHQPTKGPAMTSKRPVTHPALHAALNDGVWRDAAIAPPAAPREPQECAEASSGTTGRGEGADAADGRTAAQEDVVEQAARAILAGLKAKDRRDCEEMVRSGITPNRVRPDWRVESWTAARALADAGLLRDGDLTGPLFVLRGQRMTEAQFLAARMPLYSEIEGLEGEVERFKAQRDDLLAMKARVEALADEWADEAYPSSFDGGWNQGRDQRREDDAAALRAAIRGES